MIGCIGCIGQYQSRQFQQIWQRQVEEPNLDWVDLGLVWWARPTHLVIVGGCGLSNHGRRVGGAAFWCRLWRKVSQSGWFGHMFQPCNQQKKRWVGKPTGCKARRVRVSEGNGCLGVWARGGGAGWRCITFKGQTTRYSSIMCRFLARAGAGGAARSGAFSTILQKSQEKIRKSSRLRGQGGCGRLFSLFQNFSNWCIQGCSLIFSKLFKLGHSRTTHLSLSNKK